MCVVVVVVRMMNFVLHFGNEEKQEQMHFVLHFGKEAKTSRIYVKKIQQFFIFGKENHKTRTKLAAYERDWRLPSSPIVRKKTVVSLCKFKSVLIYTWIAKPFILPLHIFGNTKMKTPFENNSNENRRF